MVITDIPFDVKQSTLAKRYDFLRESADGADKRSASPSSLDYATFLREQEKGGNKFGQKSSKPQTRLLKPAQGRAPPSPQPTAVKVANRTTDSTKHYEKNLKLIEDNVWHEKQEERELKRIEGDIIKRQQSISHNLRDFQVAINKKKFEEEKKLSHSLSKYTELQQEDLHRKENTTKERIQQAHSEKVTEKETSRKIELTKTDCMRKFQTKMAELQTRRAAIEKLAQEFEQKIKQQEEAEHALKQQITELVLAINMNAMKEHQGIAGKKAFKKSDDRAKIDNDFAAERLLAHNLKAGDTDIKESSMHHRRLSAHFNHKKSFLNISKRDEQRHLTDTRKRLSDNIQSQRHLYDTAQNNELDKQGRDIADNVQTHTERREKLMKAAMKHRKTKHDNADVVWQAKARKRFTEQKARAYEDSLGHFQKEATKNADVEQEMYKQVRSAEYQRRKQDQLVHKLAAELAEMKRRNSVLLKEMAIKIHREETDLNQRIHRETAELDKAHSQREEQMVKLQKHRVMLKNDQYLLSEHVRENDRARRVANVNS